MYKTLMAVVLVMLIALLATVATASPPAPMVGTGITTTTWSAPQAAPKSDGMGAVAMKAEPKMMGAEMSALKAVPWNTAPMITGMKTTWTTTMAAITPFKSEMTAANPARWVETFPDVGSRSATTITPPVVATSSGGLIIGDHVAAVVHLS